MYPTIVSPRIGLQQRARNTMRSSNPRHLDFFFAGPEHALDGGPDRAFRRLLAKRVGGHQLGQHLLRRQFPVADRRKHVVGLVAGEVAEHGLEGVALDECFRVEVVASRLLLEHLAAEIAGMSLFLDADEVLDFVPRVRRDDEVQPVAARLMARRGDDLDDVAVLEPGPERHHLAVDARAHALPADVGVNRVGEIDRRWRLAERL